MINITLPDGSVRQYPPGVTGMAIAESISSGLARVALGIFVNDQPYDLSRTIDEDAYIRIVRFDDEEGKAIFWHSSAHLMAEAIEALYPGTRFGIGPPVEGGFYYDMDIADGKILTPEDLLAALDTIVQPGDVVLIKGSQNRVRLERAVKALMAHPEDAPNQLVRQESYWLRA